MTKDLTESSHDHQNILNTAMLCNGPSNTWAWEVFTLMAKQCLPKRRWSLCMT